MSGERRHSDHQYSDALMHADDDPKEATMEGASPLRPLEPVMRGVSAPQVVDHGLCAGGTDDGSPNRPSLPNKAPSYRVYSDGTADVSSELGRRPSAISKAVPMGSSKDCGIFSHRKLRRAYKKMSKRHIASNRGKPKKTGSARKSAGALSAVSEDEADEVTGLLAAQKKEAAGEPGEHFEVDIGGGEDVDGADEDSKEEKVGVLRALADIFFGKAISLLLIFIPFAWASHHYEWSPVSVFWLNFLAMVPLASILGDFTEEVAAHTNQVIGGLINATFGNAVEVVVAIQALLANEIRVVQASMIGSIFSNLLLVLGGCFFFGGLKHKEQSFNSTAATANMSLLGLSSLALVLPTPFAQYYEVEDHDVLVISRVAACFLIFMYLQLLVFQLRTHVHLFEDDEEEEAEVPFWLSVGGLVFVTLVIAKLSDYLVESIDGFCEDSGVSRTFVGLIILPIVGNAVEHITAVNVAMKDKMDLAMGVAVGSCTQISLFVIPVTVIVGWACEKNMTLNFPHFEIILFVLSVVIVSICISNPKSNWLEGSLLMTTYLMIAVGFWFERVVSYGSTPGSVSSGAGAGGVEL